ncbi:hypothetical protein EK904_003182 [Melospiza melodia maxima]|nr:hypothetical protein EK904_003182 [Melospiza melodia maxima]
METLSICVRLCEQGINPEALSSVIKELRKATEALKESDSRDNKNILEIWKSVKENREKFNLNKNT